MYEEKIELKLRVGLSRGEKMNEARIAYTNQTYGTSKER
jgi:hypothetical protein